MQLAFPSADGSVLECDLSFDAFEYANLDFFDHSRRDVLLHLSFRFRRQIVVYNQFIGGAWGPERPTPIALPPDGNVVRVEFFLGMATLIVNGAKLGVFELPEPDDGTPYALHGIAINGGATGLRLSGEAHDARQGHGLIVMDRPFLLEGWGFDPAAREQDLAVALLGTAETLPLAVMPAPERADEQRAPSDRIGAMALLPGWIWTLVEGDEAEVQLTANGRPCGRSLRITKDEIAATIERLCDGDLAGNSLEALTALEHVRFGELVPMLSSGARTRLADVSRRFKVTKFYLPPEDAAPEPLVGLLPTAAPRRRSYGASPAAVGAPTGDHADREKVIVGEEPEAPGSDDAGAVLRPSTADDTATRALPAVPAAQKELAARLAETPSAHLGEVLQAYDLARFSRDELRGLFLALSGAFCHDDRFEDLHRIAGAHGLADMPPVTEGWMRSRDLAFLYVNERAGDLVAGMRGLSDRDGWVDHGTLGWVMRKALSERPAFLARHHREDMLAAFLEYASGLAGDHFGQLPSEQLVRTCVTAIAALPTLSEDMQDRTVARIVALYGTSARLWDLIGEAQEAGGLGGLPRALGMARARFTSLRAAVEEGEFSDALLSLIESGLDRPCMRRELAANAQADGLPVHEALALAQTGFAQGSAASDDAVLRHLAFPIDMPEVPDLAEESRRVIRRRSPHVPRSPNPELQTRAGRTARRLLGAEASGAETLGAETLGAETPGAETLGAETLGADARADLLDSFFADCAILGSEHDDYLGQALAIALLSGALANRDAALAADIPGRFADLLASLAPQEQRGMKASHAVRNALWGLRQASGARRSDAARVIFDAFADVEAALPDEVTPSADTLSPKTGIAAFHDVLVVVYSCRANLTTRLPVLRRTWLADLEARGIPYIVVVGDGDGRREGDVVYLRAPDSYEALPRKSLAMAEWVLENTSFGHVFKVDDDCYLNADEAIGGLSYRKSAYTGRRLIRNPGQTDRIWHHSRGSISMAALEIDKSAEPSEYADGACGYTLNRRALQDLVETSNTRHGAWLRLASFMEDKLVGDLLSLTGIRLSSRDHLALIQRRSHRDALSVCRWENSFLPSAAAPVKVAHLDRTDLQDMAADTVGRAVLLPKRIWPSCETARLGWNNMQLALVSDQVRLDRVNAAELCVVACVRNERAMLPMFLEHYRGLGAQGFLICDNFSDDGTLEYLVDQPDVAVFSSDTDYSATHYGVAWQHALMSNLRMNRWSLIADADEFLVLPDAVRSLAALVDLPEFRNADCARIFMLDLYPEGPLSEATLATGDPFREMTHCDASPFLYSINPGPYANAQTWTSALRHRLLEHSRPDLFVAQKYALVRYRPWMRFTAGLHYAAEVRLAGRDLMFAHFKYHAAFHERARIETERGEHFNDAEEYRKYLDLMAEGRDRVFDPDLSVPWRDCDWVRRVLSTRLVSSRAAE